VQKRTPRVLRDFHSHYLKLCERTLSFAVSLRKEGEVASLESPYGLGATAEFQFRREVSSMNFGNFCRLLPPLCTAALTGGFYLCFFRPSPYRPPRRRFSFEVPRFKSLRAAPSG
jgi:hypothetical protein